MKEFLKQLAERGKKLALTIVGKKWVVLALATILLIAKLLTGEIWLVVAGFAIGANAYEKQQYIKAESEGK